MLGGEKERLPVKIHTIHPNTRVSDSLFAPINVFLELEETTR